jgi:hypothetical protein
MVFAYVANPITNYLGDPTATNFDAHHHSPYWNMCPLIVAHARAHINRVLKLANIEILLAMNGDLTSKQGDVMIN